MPRRQVPGTDAKYELIVFDLRGNELRERDNSLMSDSLMQRLAYAEAAVTDVFLISLGYTNDVSGPINQHDLFVNAMAAAEPDHEAPGLGPGGNTPLMITLQWPEIPWIEDSIGLGREKLISKGNAVEPSLASQASAFLADIADTPSARAAIEYILDAARRESGAITLSVGVCEAYATLFAESALRSGDLSGLPGADHDGFDPAAIIANAQYLHRDPSGFDVPSWPEGAGAVRAPLLIPLQQLSFWKMQDRARAFGETRIRDLLSRLQQAASWARFHIVGRGFGCIALSAALAGRSTAPRLPRPVDSLCLFQGVLSLWSYASNSPFAPGTAGCFNRIVAQKLVRGPIVTTRSTYDAVAGCSSLVRRDRHARYSGST
jgi:hypothetical protein